MAVGEIAWSSEGKQVERFARTLLPKGDYDLKFNLKSIQQKKGNKPGDVPYISVAFEALGTAQGETGKNQLVFARFFLHLLPSPKDGKVMVERQGGLLDLGNALGEKLKFSGREVPYQKYDTKGVAVGAMTRINILDPAAVLTWMNAHDGSVVRAHVKVKKGSGGYDDQNEIEYFIPAEEQEEGEHGGEIYRMNDGDELSGPTSIETEDEEQEEEDSPPPSKNKKSKK